MLQVGSSSVLPNVPSVVIWGGEHTSEHNFETCFRRSVYIQDTGVQMLPFDIDIKFLIRILFLYPNRRSDAYSGT